MFEYRTFDSKKVQDVEKSCNEMASQGWEFVSIAATDGRYCIIFRRTQQER